MSTIRVSFKDRESRAKARWLVSFSDQEGFSRFVGNLPPRDLIVDVKALKLLDEAGIKVYPPTSDGKKTSYKEPLNVAEILASLNQNLENYSRQVIAQRLQDRGYTTYTGEEQILIEYSLATIL